MKKIINHLLKTLFDLFIAILGISLLVFILLKISKEYSVERKKAHKNQKPKNEKRITEEEIALMRSLLLEIRHDPNVQNVQEKIKELWPILDFADQRFLKTHPKEVNFVTLKQTAQQILIDYSPLFGKDEQEHL